MRDTTIDALETGDLKRTKEMTSYDSTRTGNASGFGSVFSRAFAAVSSWNDERVTRKALSKLSDRELNDIGLCRGDIADVAARG